MSTIVIDVSPQTRERLEEQARQADKTVEALTRELVETALATYQTDRPSTARAVLRTAARVRSLGETLRRKIIPDVSLEEVRQALSQAAGPALSDLILEQRGPKP